MCVSWQRTPEKVYLCSDWDRKQMKRYVPHELSLGRTVYTLAVECYV